MAGLCKAGVKRQTEMKMVEGEWHCDRGDNCHGQGKKKDHWDKKTQFYLIGWNLSPKSRNRAEAPVSISLLWFMSSLLLYSKHLNCFISLLISVLQSFFFFPHLDSQSALIFISVTEISSSGAILVAGVWYNALKCSDSPKTLEKQNYSRLPRYWNYFVYLRIFFISFMSFHLHHILSHTHNNRSHMLSGTSSQEGAPDWGVVLPALFPAGQGYWQSHLAQPHQWPKPGPPSSLHCLPISKYNKTQKQR